MKLPTMSSLQRAMACTSSATLPPVAEEGSSEAAERGSFLHLFLQDALEHRNIPAGGLLGLLTEQGQRANVERFEADARAIDLDAFRGLFRNIPVVNAEVAYALNAPEDKARWLGMNIGRDYAKYGANQVKEICGSADAHGPDRDGTLCIYDYKTGVHRVAPAAENWQLKGLAVAAWRWRCQTDKDPDFTIRAGIIYTGLGNGVEMDEVVWTVSDLEEFEFQLEALTVRIQQGLRQEVEGEHCRYCPAFKNCPAKVKHLPVKPTLMEEHIASLGAGEALARIKLVRDVCDQVERTIRAMADKEPIDLGNGKVYGPTEVQMTSIDPRVAISLFGEEAQSACSVKLSKSDLMKSLGPDRSEKEVMAKLAEAGGVSYSTQVRYTERKKR